VAAGEEAEELLAADLDPDELERLVARREQGEPLAWLTGSISFCGLPVAVPPGCYVPRAQTEALARRAARRLPPGGRAADLCTGVGPVAALLAAAVPSATVVGTDLDGAALDGARRNGVRAVRTDLGDGLAPGAFDVVTAVAPYVPTGDLAFLPSDVQRYEPPAALDGGPDGCGVLRRVVLAGARLLRPGGTLLVELGGDEDVCLAPDLAAAGFAGSRTWRDREGDLRGLAARLG
jgi:release factor glutamine methyltransferase